MKTQIEDLLEDIGRQMQARLSNKNFGEIAHLANYLNKAESIKQRVIILETELAEIKASLCATNEEGGSVPKYSQKNNNPPIQRKAFGRAENKTIRIEINWEANGKSNGHEVIALPMAADGMAAFLARVIEEVGHNSIQKLARIRISRGPLISKSPDRDFVNQKNGKLYNHKNIPRTEYSVLTNNQTSEKVEALKQACREVGLVEGSVKITELNKSDLYMDRYLKM